MVDIDLNIKPYKLYPKVKVSVSLTQLIETMHNICRVSVRTPDTPLIHLKKCEFLITRLFKKKAEFTLHQKRVKVHFF